MSERNSRTGLLAWTWKWSHAYLKTMDAISFAQVIVEKVYFLTEDPVVFLIGLCPNTQIPTL